MPLTALFPASRMAAMRDHLRRFAAGFGITSLRHADRLPNTRRALAAAERARDLGRLEPFRNAAMSAYWEDGRDLEDDAVLEDVARRAGVDPAEALAASNDPAYQARIDRIREEAADRGVTGIPTFFFGDVPIVGCVPYEVLERAARRSGAARR